MAFKGELRPFQKPAFDRMIERQRVLVAYRMGLGKTPITIAVIENLLDHGDVECGLVVAQSSLKYQWMREIDKFTDGARVLVIDGDPRERERQYRQARKGMYEYVILSYDNIVRDFDQVELIPMDYMVCDEATHIKGFRSQRSKKVKQLRPAYRFALSGQPVENRPEELYSIMQWVDPKVLGNFVEFERTFINRYAGSGAVRKYRNLKLLNKVMGDAMVRATWDEPEIQAQMPAVVEENEYVDFDPATYKLYRYIGLDLLRLLREFPAASSFNLSAHYGFTDDPETAKARGEAMARITAMSMLCDSPALLVASAAEWEASLGSTRPKGSEYVYELSRRGLLSGVTGTPKLDVLVERLVDQLDADERNKLVVFSQHPAMLYDIRAKLRLITECSMLTGSMSAKARDASKQQFINDKNTRVFLSSDAGGYGLDLPNANYLHNFDLPWSGGKLEQRNARIIRLSSEFQNVTLINWLMLGSIEERRYDMLAQKQRVASAWIDGKGIRGKGGELVLTLGTLTDFLEQSIAA